METRAVLSDNEIVHSHVPNPSRYVECIELQLSEIDMLKSMFPERSEFRVEEKNIKEMRSFVQGSSVLPAKTEYSVHLSSNKGKVSLYAALPAGYPCEFPDIYVRSDRLTRQTQLELNSQLRTFLETLEKGDLMVGSAVAWLQEHADDFLQQQVKGDEGGGGGGGGEKSSVKEDSFLRLWIYSHHIYSKVKRKDIKDLADEYQLTGFCLPGKPGIICAEGLSNNVNDWWHMVRSWNWQKILCKKEEKKLICAREISKHRRFNTFEELGPDSHIRIKTGGFHVDMGDLFRFLEEHDSGYMFEEYFGVRGK